jgi:predicted dehydrogenase
VACAGAGRVAEIDATLRYRKSGDADYDELCLLQLQTDTGFVGRVVQDVVTSPPSKTAWIQGSKGSLTWTNGYAAGKDALAITYQNSPEPVLREFEKTRADDFLEEIRHIQAALEHGQPSPISLESGLDTMLAIAGAHRSNQSKRRVRIVYDRGYNTGALENA